MRTRKLIRWLLAVVFVPMLATAFGTTTCTFRGEGDIDDGDGVIIVTDDE